MTSKLKCEFWLPVLYIIKYIFIFTFSKKLVIWVLENSHWYASLLFIKMWIFERNTIHLKNLRPIRGKTNQWTSWLWFFLQILLLFGLSFQRIQFFSMKLKILGSIFAKLTQVTSKFQQKKTGEDGQWFLTMTKWKSMVN